MNEHPSDSRVIVITGGAGGLGIPVTSLFLGRGCSVIVPLHAETDEKKLRSAIDLTLSNQLDTTVADITDEQSVNKLYKHIEEKYSRLDVLAHLAGGIRPKSVIAETTTEDWDYTMNVNLRSAFLNARSAMKIMMNQRGGSIVTVSAMTALKPESGKAAYGAAKAGIIALTRTLADEGRAFNINANAIAPSIIRTAANLKWANGKEAEDWVVPEDIAEMMYFLTSPAGHSINGTVIREFGKLAL